MKCQSCGYENNDNSKYCIKCGAQLKQADNTNNSTTYIDEKDRFFDELNKENNTNEQTNNNTNKTNDYGVNNDYRYVNNINRKEVNQVNTTSLIFGILSICFAVVCFCIPFVAQITSITLAIVALVQVKKERYVGNSGKSNAALILSIISLVISIFFILVYVIALINGTIQANFDLLNPNNDPDVGGSDVVYNISIILNALIN